MPSPPILSSRGRAADSSGAETAPFDRRSGQSDPSAPLPRPPAAIGAGQTFGLGIHFLGEHADWLGFRFGSSWACRRCSSSCTRSFASSAVFYKFPMPEFLAGLIDNPIRRKIQPPDATAVRHGIEPGMTVLEVGPRQRNVHRRGGPAGRLRRRLSTSTSSRR